MTPERYPGDFPVGRCPACAGDHDHTDCPNAEAIELPINTTHQENP